MRVVVLTIVLLAAGCTHEVRVRSKPSGATVFLNNKAIGATPLTFEQPGSVADGVTLKLEKAGYTTKETTLLPLPSDGACLFSAPWRRTLPPAVFFQLYPAGATDSARFR